MFDNDYLYSHIFQDTSKKSPGTIYKEKSALRLEEARKREEIKQEIKERDREHDAKTRKKRRADVGSMFSISNTGAFVSSLCAFAQYFIL